MSVTACKQFTKEMWPFYLPGVNPLAPETPDRLARALFVYLAAEEGLSACLGRTTRAQGPGRRWSCAGLDAAYAAERQAAGRFERAGDALLDALRGHPGYHRGGEVVASVIWRFGGERLDVLPAFTRVSSFPTRDPKGHGA